MGEVKYTEEQLQKIKLIADFSFLYLEQVYKIMVNHGLDKVEGCGIDLYVAPKFESTTMTMSFGQAGTESGSICLTKGKNDETYHPLGTNSAEYEILFAEPEVAERMRKAFERKQKPEKELPPDGLCISLYDYPPVLDSRRDVK